METETINPKEITFNEFKETVLNDFKLALKSREVSLLGRKEVLTGKAKFGIFGDGKELPQIALSKVFRNGDFRSGYYRDQTFMMAIKALNVQQFFAQLYAHTNIALEPSSAGRQMTGHFSTQSLDKNGMWKKLTNQKNSSSDISPTAGQMPRLLGLAQASKYYRNNPEISFIEDFSIKGNEIAFGTIGNASTSEGMFFEAINAAGVMQVPMVMSVWDDAYGISVPAKYQTTKESISEILKGFQRDENSAGFEIIKVKGWDYVALVEAYKKAEKIARKEHVPVLVHVTELTQPQGHSTSGSHERYKSKERLEWEKKYDCIVQFKNWILDYNVNGVSLATEEELKQIEKEVKKEVKEDKQKAWESFQDVNQTYKKEVLGILEQVLTEPLNSFEKLAVENALNKLNKKMVPMKKEAISAAREVLRAIIKTNSKTKSILSKWISQKIKEETVNYSSHLYSESELSPLKKQTVMPSYSNESEDVDARVILRENFDRILNNRREVLIFGEDSGYIGDVNQGLEGLQVKHGEDRVSDVGIRECTILGQGIGMAMRGLRPIAEIQYLDYLLYALQIMSDDLATVHYRTAGQQKAPVIVRTRGHRLEGVWHAGSPMGAILSTLRGIHVLVPRNMTKAAAFYNTLLESDDPALVIECLNSYRLKEKMPNNLSEIRQAIGEVEVTREGTDVTLVTYGSTWRLVMEAAQELSKLDVHCEVIDAQSLLPFDVNHDTIKSITKTNRLVIIDEDVPGGGTAYLLQHILEKQNAYRYLDSKPICISAKEHRPAYASDGDYFSKPSTDDMIEKIYELMHEYNPEKYPSIY